MNLLNGKLLKKIAGASGAYDPSWAGASMKQGQHPTYGGQGGGFVGTQSNGMDLKTLVTENSCVTGILGGLVAGGPSVSGAIRGVIGGSIAGQCYSGNGNGGGGGTGSSNSGSCGGDSCSW